MKSALRLLLLAGMVIAMHLIPVKAHAQSCNTQLLIAYSSQAADSLGNDSIVVQAIINAVNELNTSYIYSEVFQQATLVRTVRLNDFESGCFANDLNNFQESSYISALRDKYHADIAVIVLSSDEFCGLPYIDNEVADASTAYCAVNGFCMITNFAVSHQTAHLYGCSHAAQSKTEKSDAPYPYGHGFDWIFNECAYFSTIMGVDDDDFCGGSGEDACNIIPYYSNPSLQYNGVQLGQEGLNDNARVLNENKALIGAFKIIPATQTNLIDTVNLSNTALAMALDTLSTGSTYMITGTANVVFQTGNRIVLNPGFSAAEGVRFEAVIKENDPICGQ